jgi:hypothetical protein
MSNNTPNREAAATWFVPPRIPVQASRSEASSADGAEDDSTDNPSKEERDGVVARIEYLRVVWLETETDDGRAEVQQVLAECEKRLRQLAEASRHPSASRGGSKRGSP